MNFRFSIAVLLLSSIAALALASCGDPSDAVAFGELCVPETDQCSAHAELERPGVGRNGLEYTIYTDSAMSPPSTVELRITTDDEVAFPDSEVRETNDDGDTILFERSYPLAEGETVRETLGSFELTVAERMNIELRCVQGGCAHTMTYTYFSDAIECVDDGVCSRTEVCELAYGRCAECVEDGHCDSGQTCDRETGLCFPGDARGCQSVPAPSGLALLLIALSALALRQRDKWRRRAPMVLLALATTALFVMPPSQAHAGGSATMNIGGGVRVLTGEAGQLTHPGWGITVTHQVRLHRLAMNFQLASNSFGLAEAAGTERGSISGYGITLGPRWYFPLPFSISALAEDRPFEAFVGVDYTRWSVAENRLAPVTGLDLNYHAVGPSTGVVWTWRGFELTARLNASQIFSWPGGVFSFDLLVGLAP